MIKPRLSLVLALAATIAGATGMVAEDFEIAPVSFENVPEAFAVRYTAMERELEELRAQSGGGDGKSYADCCDDGCYCCEGGWSVFVEGTVFQYNRADGHRVGNAVASPDEDFSPDWFVSPRISLGYQRCGGLGIRARWWSYDHATLSPHDPPFPARPNHEVSVDTYTMDFEIFDTFSWCNWDFDISAGVRYNDFEELLINTGGGGLGGGPVEIRRNASNGWGGIIGLEGIRHLGCSNSALYARSRASVISADKALFNVDNGVLTENRVLNDVTQGQLELGAGYQYSRCWRNSVISLRAGFEWQLWYNYSSVLGGVNGEGNFLGSSDVGFIGFNFGGGISY